MLLNSFPLQMLLWLQNINNVESKKKVKKKEVERI